MSKPDVIDVDVVRERDWFIANSENLNGLFVAYPDMPTLVENLPNMIKALYKFQHGIDVNVVEASSGDQRNVFPIRYVTSKSLAA